EGADPERFTLNAVVKGWTEGLQLVGEGGKIQLYVPAELAYGEQGRPGIDPNSVLIFDVDLLKVGKAVPAAPAAE
ncbi:MAG: FKBP-type peptidyl-prolyl cis-trans isomerase, partial [Bacteroidales bacterium]|nr:FKBP-type peptidyl-prolyl cis-trans isomerase [Bacteroidales bacterium]